jgi:hypothetical protein
MRIDVMMAIYKISVLTIEIAKAKPPVSFFMRFTRCG